MRGSNRRVVRGHCGRAIILALCATLVGCASSAPPRKPASLSDAAREAKKPPEKQEPLVAKTPEPPPVVQEPEPEASYLEQQDTRADSAKAAEPVREERVHFGFTAGAGALGGGKLDGFGVYGVQFGAYPGDHWRLDLEGVAMDVQFSDESHLGESLTDALGLALDVSTRWYLTPGHTFLGVYPVAGIRWGTLLWSYANPLTVVDAYGVRTVSDDALGFFTPYLGAGAGLVQLRHMQIGVRGIAGWQLYDVDTREGFHNDLIKDTGFVEFRVECVYVH